MNYQDMTINEFNRQLASKAPVPGGGGVCAVVGALGSALASMVANLTTGKKKYARYEEQVQAILTAADEISRRLLALADEDAAAFQPLSQAYSIPKDDPQREAIMDAALLRACQPPMEIMEVCCMAISLHEQLCVCGSAIAISDVAVGAALCGAALRGASCNVFINAQSLSDKARAEALCSRAQGMLDEYLPRAEKVMCSVEARIKG